MERNLEHADDGAFETPDLHGDILVDLVANIVRPAGDEGDDVNIFQLFVHNGSRLVLNRFELLDYRDDEFTILFIVLKVLKMAPELVAKVGEGEVASEKVPELIVQEVYVQRSLLIYRKLR